MKKLFKTYEQSLGKVVQNLRNRKRPQIPAELLDRYHAELQKQYSLKSRKTIFSWRIRIVEIGFAVFLGIIAGWFFFSQETSSNIQPYLNVIRFEKPVSQDDLLYLKAYLQATEIIMLDVLNRDVEEIDIRFSKEIAQNLLIKTFILHEKVLKVNEPRILKYLSRMEILFFELSNSEEAEFTNTLKHVRWVIEETDLLPESRELLQIVDNTQQVAG
jgi:hypothetical protein